MRLQARIRVGLLMTTRRRSLLGATVTALLAASVLAGCGATFGPSEGQLETWAEAALDSDPAVVAVAAYSTPAGEALWYDIRVYVTLREGEDVSYETIVNVYRALYDAPGGRWRDEEVSLRFLSAEEEYRRLDAGAVWDTTRPAGDPTGCVSSQREYVLMCLDSPEPVL